MKTRYSSTLLFLSVLFALLPAVSSAQSDCEPETRISLGFSRIYIGLRNGTDGSGKSPQDARDGSTADNFDRILRCYSEGCGDPTNATEHVKKTENLIVCLSSGTFRTKGTYDFVINVPHKSGQGFTVGKGWKIHGAGKDKTTLQLAEFLPMQSAPNSHNLPAHTGMGVVISTNSDQASDIEISDLTVDANFPELKRRASQQGIKGLNLHAIQLRSDRGHNWIHDVNVMRTAGEIGAMDTKYETFPVWIFSVGANSKPTDNSGNIIERVKMSDFGGGICTAVAIGNAVGEVRNNRVEGYQIGYGGWLLGPAYFHDNVAVETEYGFNIDSLANNGVRIERNQIIHPRKYGFVIGGNGNFTGFVIRDNKVQIDHWGVIGLLFQGGVTNTQVVGNSFLAEQFFLPSTAIKSFLHGKGTPNSNNSFQGNTISDKLRITFSDRPKQPSDCMAGNHDEQGRPLRNMPDNHAATCTVLPAVSH